MGLSCSSGSQTIPNAHTPLPPNSSQNHLQIPNGGNINNLMSNNEITAQLSAQITDWKIVKDSVVKPYAMYIIEIKTVNNIGIEEILKIDRRYSDFYALHQKVISKYPKLDNIAFPGKKAFGNTDKNVLEKRKKMLDAFIKELLKPERLSENEELIVYMHRFLDHTSSYESERHSNVLKSATSSMKNSVKNVAHAVTSVPTNMIHTVGTTMFDGISRAVTVRQI